MADDKKNIGGQDRARVSSSEDYEVEDLHQQFPQLSHQEVLEGIKTAGPLRENIIRHLKDKIKK